MNVTPLCQRVSPLKTLHALCTSWLCQRVTLFFKKNYSKAHRGDRPLVSPNKFGSIFDRKVLSACFYAVGLQPVVQQVFVLLNGIDLVVA